MAGLAIGLALLTMWQLRTWRTPQAVWTRAHVVAPEAPRPMVNLGLLALSAGRPGEAEQWLRHASQAATRQTPALRRWTEDVIAANRAVLAIRVGEMAKAARLLCGAPRWSARGIVAARVSTLCPSS